MPALIVQVLAVPSVILLFKFLPRWVASLSVSLVFITVAVVSMAVFYKKRELKSYSFWVWSAFLYVFVIPILAIRLAAGIFYDGSVEAVYPIVGILHKAANPAYVLAVIASVVEYLQNKKAAK